MFWLPLMMKKYPLRLLLLKTDVALIAFLPGIPSLMVGAYIPFQYNEIESLIWWVWHIQKTFAKCILHSIFSDFSGCLPLQYVFIISATTGKRSRAQSAVRSLPPSRGTPSSGLFPPAIIWPNNRTLTPDMGGLNNEPAKKMLRPKTVSRFPLLLYS